MPTVEIMGIAFGQGRIVFELNDGRAVSTPLAWYPRLFNATPAQRENWRLIGGGEGVHWPDVDEDLSLEGVLRGVPARQPRPADPRV